MSDGPIMLTQAERGAYAHFFALADPSSTGVVSGSNAVSFFALSGLPSPVLGSIWELSDRDNNGFLTPAHFSIALRLIGHAQAGKVITEDLARHAPPIPTFKGISLPPHLAAANNTAAASPIAPPSRTSSTMVQPQLTGGSAVGGQATLNVIPPEYRARYARIFAGAGPQGGLLDGEKAKEVFVKSKLPFDKLGAIWNLADTKARGMLDLTDFTIGMHFIQCTMNGSLTSIPSTLPAGLYEKAANTASGAPGTPSAAVPLTAQNTGGSASGFVPRQMTGAGASRFGAPPGSPVPSTIRSPPQQPSILQAQRTGNASFGGAQPTTGPGGWVVSAAEKSKADQFFDGLDQDNKGVLEGQAAVPFFMQSGLGEAVLAHVWDLSDITQSGTLTRDEFAVAMHLINQKLTGSELPQELSPNVIPPSLRGQHLPQAVNPQQTDTQKDLFSLLDDDVDLPVSTASAFATHVPTSSNRSQAPPAAAVADPSKGAFDGAFDDDFLGGKPAQLSSPSAQKQASKAVPFSTASPGVLSAQPTGVSTPGGGGSGIRNIPPVNDASTEAANHRLALESTQRSLTDLETSKADLTKNVDADANNITDLTTRLETVRVRHQTETEAVTALKQRYTSQAAELKRLREESVREESELSRLKAEKDEVEQALMNDREDVREMKRLVGERTRERESLKAEIEKLKKDSRQQKGLLAISKKQLAQSENDVAKTQQELEQSKVQSTQEHDKQEHAAHGEVALASQQTEPAREEVTSPALSVRSTNPFDRASPAPSGAAPHKGAAAALGGAMAGGAIAAGVGSTAFASHNADHDDEKSVEDHAGLALQKADDNDPFGVGGAQPTSQGQPAQGRPSTDDAFSGFNDQFVPEGHAASAGPQMDRAQNESFDDAFADMNEPPKTAPSDAAAPAPITSEDHLKHMGEEKAPGGIDDAASVPSSFAAAEKGTSDVPPLHSAINDEGVSQSALQSNDLRASSASAATSPQGIEAAATDAQGFTTTKGAATSGFEKGKAPVAEANEDGGESSEDDNEGPEDIDAAAGKRFGDLRPAQSYNTAIGEEPQTEEPLNTSTGASDRFPDIENDATAGETQSYETPAPAPAFSAPDTTSAPLEPSLSVTGTGASDADAFHDAASETNVPLGSGFVQGHERFATAKENVDAPSTGSSQQRSVSPAKARRAPPAIPSRSGTSALGDTAPQAINAGPFTGMTGEEAGAGAAPASNNPMDDFDAAFEDLGPPNGGAGTGFGSSAGAGDTSQTSAPGFDDTFGEADGFDFVPSFSTNNIAGQAGGNAYPDAFNKSSVPKVSAPEASTGAGAFDGFDSAFDASAFEPAGGGAVSSASVPAGQATNPSSGAGSGFSFDDAFVPAEMISTGTSSPTGAGDYRPTLPPRRETRPSDTTTATAASHAPASTGEPSSALADDAGPVKQLCQMGFTRPDVIKALERSNYRTEKALERLLAQT